MSEKQPAKRAKLESSGVPETLAEASKDVVIKPKRTNQRAKRDEIGKICSELVDKEEVKPSATSTESAHPQNEQSNEAGKEQTPDLQNRFDKNSVDDMKKLKALKDKIRRCDVQIKKYQAKLEELTKQLPRQ